MSMNWTFANCTCSPGLHCIRPSEYSKPRLCIPVNIYPNSFNNYISNPSNYLQIGFGGLEKIILNAILFVVLLSLLLQLGSILCVYLKKQRRRVTTQTIRQPIRRATHPIRQPICKHEIYRLPEPLVVDARPKHKVVEMKTFGTHAESTLAKMERLVQTEAHQHSL